MKIGAIIPTRGDRPEFLNFALKQLNRQSYNLDVIEVIDDKPLNQDKDITWRYRIGCERIFSKGVDLAFFIEDDDYYSISYIEKMLKEWEKFGRPDIFGIGDTYYYHLGVRSIYHQRHLDRSSAYNTLVTSSITQMNWPSDNFPFTDIHIWKKLRGKTYIPEKLISLGIKHGIGLTGGIGHNSQWMSKNKKDNDLSWLKQTVDEEAFDFYKKISEQLK